ncbi:hypothetical protein [Paenarthrobacter sp. PH39-S1]|uniref:hypothetical protein n=1 Tax=Paenarthrobacter sp. PH39-S1 TaxID=3046204 RepID=UPI0024B96328|nr:hypothetical protein [Paenarthrobacter sp. PH39-S1]MDJ0358223.1 hypothetical protein [Paenarthrobacter sp. PH39-S1]
MRVSALRGRRVGTPAVGEHAASRLDIRIEESSQAFRADIGYDAKPDPPEAVLFDLDSCREQHLSQSATARDPGLWASKE